MINTVLVCLLAQRILSVKRAWIFAGMYFGLTATHANSILWICGRTDLLCATFYLLSILTYLAFLDKGSQKIRLVSLCAFMLSLLTKEMAGSLPLLHIVWSIFIFKGKHNCGILCAANKAFKASWPYFSLLAGYFVLRYLIFGHLPTNPTHSDWMLRPILENLARYGLHLFSPMSFGIIQPLFGDANFFLVHDAQTIAGKTNPQVGYTYATPNSTVQITETNRQKRPSSLATQIKSSILAEKQSQLLLFSRGRLAPVE